MVDVQTEIEINRPIGEVADYAADPLNAPEWYVNIKSARILQPDDTGTSDAKVSAGSRIAFIAQFMGRVLNYTYEIVEFVPHERMVMRTSEGPFPMETTYTWTAVDDGSTKMTLRNAGKPSGFSKWMAPLMSMMMRKANAKDLRKIKRILEAAG